MPLEVPREKKISLQYEVCPLSSALIPNGGERIPKPYGNCHSFLYLSVKWRCRLGPQRPFLVSTLVLFICYFKRFFYILFKILFSAEFMSKRQLHVHWPQVEWQLNEVCTEHKKDCAQSSTGTGQYRLVLGQRENTQSLWRWAGDLGNCMFDPVRACHLSKPQSPFNCPKISWEQTLSNPPDWHWSPLASLNVSLH